MRNFIEISERDLEYIKKIGNISVYEKLDAIRFKVCIGYDYVNVYSSKGRLFQDVDTIINTTIKSILDFSYNLPSLDIYERYGECHLWFSYIPVNKTKVITYSDIKPGTFVLTSFYTKNKAKKDSNINEYINGADSYPLINHFFITDLDFNNFQTKNVVEFLTDGKTWSGNSIDDIEGLVVECGNRQWKVDIKDTKPYIEQSTKIIYRDTIIEDFIHVVPEDAFETAFSKDDTYLSIICDLFLEYIERTNIFSTTLIEEDDVEPPIEGYVGDVDYDRLPSTVRLVCKGNPVFKNVLRILLNTFSYSPFENRFKRFSDKDRVLLNNLLLKFRDK